MADSASRRVIMGRISGLFGVRGWVKVYSYTEPREQILQYPDWQIRHGSRWQSMRVAESAAQGKGVVARLEGVEDRDQAAGLVGSDIAVAREMLPEVEGEYYWCDLQGMRVRTIAGEDLGVVDHLFSTGANDVVVVRGQRERMLPWLRPEVIRDVDTGEGVITVDWDPEF